MAKHNEWKKTRTIYWKDERNDDFDEVGLKRPPVPENYPYIRKNPFGIFFGGILYHLIAKPIFWIYCTCKGIRFKNKHNLKQLHGGGAFLYSNHTAITDVFKFQAKAFFFGRKVNILGFSDTLSMKFVRGIARALGYLPVPLKGDLNNLVALSECCNYLITKKKQFVLIYPEAHIWPYYTKIRNFPDGSFNYPARYNLPVVPVVTTWRKPLVGKKPKQTVIFGEPIFPDPNLGLTESKNQLHDECYRRMKEISESVNQYKYINYVYQGEKKNND